MDLNHPTVVRNAEASQKKEAMKMLAYAATLVAPTEIYSAALINSVAAKKALLMKIQQPASRFHLPELGRQNLVNVLIFNQGQEI